MACGSEPRISNAVKPCRSEGASRRLARKRAGGEARLGEREPPDPQANKHVYFTAPWKGARRVGAFPEDDPTRNAFVSRAPAGARRAAELSAVLGPVVPDGYAICTTG